MTDEHLDPTFRTPDGQEWTIELTYPRLIEIQDETGFWLSEMFDPEQSKHLTPRKLFELYVAACKPQWTARNMTAAEFANLFTTEESGTNAVRALEAAVILFSHPSKRAVLEPARKKVKRFMEAKVQELTETALRELDRLGELQLAGESGSSAESLESIPTGQ